MLQHILWAITFFSLWLVLIWLQVIYSPEKKGIPSGEIPSVTIAVPAYNEESTIQKTLSSLSELSYPKEKIEIIVVDDGSRDMTSDSVSSFISENPGINLRLISQKNTGKGGALNAALESASGDLFAVVDADSRVDRKSLRNMLHHFKRSSTGAVISRIRVDEPKKLIERIQRFEYIMSNMIRSLMSRIDTLALTPGVLSVYRTDVLRKLGGFDSNRENLTEDLEIALRLRYNNYKVMFEPDSITHTKVPSGFTVLWRQRIRWARGFIHNHWRYRRMLFSRKHSTFGIFQMPVNIVVVLLLIANISIISYSLMSNSIEFAVRSATIEGYFINYLLDFPTIEQFLLSQNLRIIIPVAASTALGIFLIFATHWIFRENLSKQIVPVFAYFLFIPYFITLNWISSFAHEIMKSKKKW